MEAWAIVLAAGKGTRMGGSVKKQFLSYKGMPLWASSALTFMGHPRIRGVIAVFPEEELQQARETAGKLSCGHLKGVPLICTAGGRRRQDSVACGLAALPSSCTHVLIHDGARPFLKAGLITRILEALEGGARAAVPALGMTDTVKTGETENGRLIARSTIPREKLFTVQTPQGFSLEAVMKAHERFEGDATDDASMTEAMGIGTELVPGDSDNVKVTRPEDRALLEEIIWEPCTGFGYDVHKYGGNRPVRLGGVDIPSDLGIWAHSDGDVLLHALMDALLGCMGEKDIGQHFPDSDPAFENIPSSVLLDRVMELWHGSGLRLTHADLTVIAQKPKIGPYVDAIRSNTAAMLGLPAEKVSVKATTEEGLGFTGELRGIKAAAVVSAVRKTVL